MKKMSLYFFVALVCLIGFIQSKECYISKVNKQFLVQPYDGLYYLFSRDREKFQKAYEVCRNINGYLTDLTVNTVTFFKQLVEVNTSSISYKTYWIGLLWTPSLKNQVWDSGRKYIDQKSEPPLQGWPYRLQYYHCTVLHLNSREREWKHCNDSHAYICMLDIASVQKTHNDTCLLNDNAFNETSTTPEVNTTDDSDNTATPIPFLPNTNATTECVNVTDQQGKCDCQKQDQIDAFISNTTVHLTFGLIIGASVVINIIQGVVNYRNGKKHRHLVTEKLTALAFMDNLNVDNQPVSGPYSENGDAPEREHKQICTITHQDVYTNEGLPEMVYHDIDQAHNETSDTHEYLDVY